MRLRPSPTGRLPADRSGQSPLQPLRGVDVTVDLRGTFLPVPGVYRFEVWCQDALHAIVPLSAWLSD